MCVQGQNVVLIPILAASLFWSPFFVSFCNGKRGLQWRGGEIPREGDGGQIRQTGSIDTRIARLSDRSENQTPGAAQSKEKKAHARKGDGENPSPKCFAPPRLDREGVGEKATCSFPSFRATSRPPNAGVSGVGGFLTSSRCFCPFPLSHVPGSAGDGTGRVVISTHAERIISNNDSIGGSGCDP